MEFFLQQVVNGLALGSIYALLAIGFSMIYGVVRIMNFAHGDIYAFSTVCIAGLVSNELPVVPAIVVGLSIGAALSVAVERTCYKPLRFVDRSVALISALGAAYFIRNAGEYLWGVRPLPFPGLIGSGAATLGEVRIPLTGIYVLAFALASVILFGLFLRRTKLGKGIVFIGQDISTSSLMGISVNWTVTAAYMMGGALAATGGILYGSMYGVAIPAMGFAWTLKAFVAAIVGGVGNLTGALVAGLSLGVIENLIVVFGSEIGISPGYRDAFAFVVLIIFLAFKPTGLLGTRLSVDDDSQLQATTSSARKTSLHSGIVLGALAESKVGRGVSFAIVVALLLTFPFMVTDSYVLRIVNLIMIYGIAVLGLNLVLGLCGQFHFGQAGFLAIGAYTTALMMVDWDVNFALAMAVSTMLALVIGVLVGIPALRITGYYLALVTLGVAEIVRLFLVNSDFTRGPMGIPGIPHPEIAGMTLSTNRDWYYFGLLLLFASYHVCARLARSSVGRAWRSIAEDEMAAAAMGINAGYYKVLAFSLACGLAGMAGSYMATYMRYISPASFTVEESVLILIMLVLGGRGNLFGSIVGAGIMIVVVEFLRPIAEFRTGFIGLLLILLARFRPYGLFSGMEVFLLKADRAIFWVAQQLGIRG